MSSRPQESRPSAATVSIIVPSYNQGRFIAKTLDSILSQSFKPLEVIVVDGGSTDDTVAILRDYAARHAEIRWISEKDEGPADAVNKGLALARGEICAIQSSDDLYNDGALADAVRVMSESPDCGFVYGDIDCVNGDGHPLGSAKVPAFSWEAFFGIALCIPQSSIFFRTILAREVGGWNGSYYGCDLDFWLRLLLRTRARRIPRALSTWRIYPEQRTRPERYERIWIDYCRMIEESEDLRRAPARVRRLARASCHILALKMLHGTAPFRLRWHLLCALALHPTFWRYESRGWAMNACPELRLIRAARRRLRALLGAGSRRAVGASGLP